MAKYILYHGTNARFSRFDIKRSPGNVIWFSDSVEEIRSGMAGAQSSKIILKCEVTINNPAGWDEYEKLCLGQIADLKYDGIILTGSEANTYVVFKASQVKILGDVPPAEGPLNEQITRMKSIIKTL